MKKKGSIFQYMKDRDEDLMRVYKQELSKPLPTPLKDILNIVVNSRAKRFWVSEERATAVICKMLKGESIDYMSPLRQEMYREICRRVIHRKSLKPYMTTTEAVLMVVNEPAPKFYITPESANMIICKLRKRKRKEQSQRTLRLSCQS